MNKTKGVLLTLVGGILWALSGACGQFLFQYKEVTSNWLVPIRLSTAGAILLIVLYFQRGKMIFVVWKTPRNAIQILSYAIFGMMLCQYTYFTTIQYSNASVGTVLQYLAPILILTVECITKRALPSIRQLLSLLLAVGGTFLLATHGNPGVLVISRRALLWGLVSAAMYAFYTLYSSRLLRHYDSQLIIGWGMFLGGILLTTLLRPWNHSVIFDGQTVLALIVIIIFGSILSFTLYTTGVKYVGPVTAGMLAAIEPVASTVLAVVWLGTDFTLMDGVGILCILSTVFLLAIPAKTTKDSQTRHIRE